VLEASDVTGSAADVALKVEVAMQDEAPLDSIAP